MGIEMMQAILPLQSIDSKGAAAGLDANGGSSVPFADLLSQAMKDVNTTQQDAAQDAYGLVMGESADLHTVMIRSAMETAAIETAVELTSRVVGAYKEIMQMQI